MNSMTRIDLVGYQRFHYFESIESTGNGQCGAVNADPLFSHGASRAGEDI
jgi:hypothetical protein